MYYELRSWVSTFKIGCFGPIWPNLVHLKACKGRHYVSGALEVLMTLKSMLKLQNLESLKSKIVGTYIFHSFFDPFKVPDLSNSLINMSFNLRQTLKLSIQSHHHNRFLWRSFLQSVKIEVPQLVVLLKDPYWNSKNICTVKSLSLGVSMCHPLSANCNLQCAIQVLMNFCPVLYWILIFYQKSSVNTRSMINSSMFWVSMTFRYFCSKLKFFSPKIKVPGYAI